MEVKNWEVKPYEDHISPALEIDVEIGHQEYKRAIIGVKGWLKTLNGKTIASVEEMRAQNKGEIAANGSSFDRCFKKGAYETTLVAVLNERALESIDIQREKDRKGDVKLRLKLIAKYLETNALISHIHYVKPESVGREIRVQTSKGEEKGELLAYSYDPDFSSPTSRRWILSGNGSPVFLAEGEEALEEELSVSASDWIRDYAPKLGLGDYFVVEIPMDGEVIKEAWGYVERAEVGFMNWNTEKVFSDCREAGSLLNSEIKRKFGKNSFTYKERWGSAYKNFGHFSSLGLHKEDFKEGYHTKDVKIQREDAEHLLIVTKSLVKYAERLLSSAS